MSKGSPEARGGYPRDPLARLLLLLYPRRFRHRYGGELWRFHRRLHADAGRGCRLGRLRLYRDFALDSLRNGPPARLTEPTPAGRSPRPAPPPRRPPVHRPLDSLRLDLRHALRALARRPGFTAVAVLTLALGLGANVTLYNLVDAVLLRPLGYAQPDRVVRLLGVQEGRKEQRGTIAYLDFVDWVERSDVFSDATAYDEWTPNLTTGGPPVRLSAAVVNTSFFDVLGVKPAAGRFFVPQEDVDGQDRVVVLSYALWQRRFGGEADVVGRSVDLNGQAHQVIGVAPQDLEDPRLSGAAFDRVELWRPLGLGGLPAEQQPSRGSTSYTAIARLAPGGTRQQAEDRLAALAADLAREHPDTNVGRGLRLVPLQEHLVGGVRRTLALLMGAVAFVLLIAVANVANLLLGRAAERRREAAVRSALGAGRGRLLRTLVMEALVLTTLGGLLGVGGAVLVTRLLSVRAADLLPRALPPSPSPAVLLVAAALTLAAGLVCGLVPALFLLRGDLRAPLRAERSTGSRESTRLRAVLVVAEVTVSITLLVGAGLLAESFWRLSRVDPGVDTEGVLTFRLSLPGSDYPDRESAQAFFASLLPRLEALPGVESAATANLAPMSGGFDCNSVSAAERPEPPRSERLCAETRTVTPSYFDTLGLHLLAGRTLSRRDRADAPPVTVISHALAAALWPGEPAVGRRLRAFGGEMEVVGVVGDVKHQRLDEPSPASLFMTREQSLAQWQIHWSTVLLRTSGDPTALLPAARRAVWSLDPALPLSAETTLQRLVADSVSTERLRTVLLVAFAAVATVLAALGLYGVLAYLVVQRRFELAVRLALGARRGRVVRMVVGQGLVLVLAGVGLGLAAALALSRLLAGLLFQVAPTDPAAFLTVALLMLAVGLAASWLPARRAARVEPAQALRGG